MKTTTRPYRRPGYVNQTAGKPLTSTNTRRTDNQPSSGTSQVAMLAYALLAILAATERTQNPTPQRTSLIALTCNEIHRLFNTLIAGPIRDIRHRLHWSTWRRRHQHRARTSHYHRRQTPPA